MFILFSEVEFKGITNSMQLSPPSENDNR